MAEDVPMRVLTRFPEGADAETKRQFGRDLLKALDELGVEPEDEFTVLEMPPEDEGPDIEAVRQEESTRVLLALFDFRRGTIDADELTERVLLAYQDVVHNDLDVKAHVLMGLPHTGGLGQ